MATVEITGGEFQDGEGNKLSGGTLRFSLSADATDTETSTQQICAGQSVSFTLDSNGNVPTGSYLWPNDLLISNVSGAADTFYWITVEDVNGQLVYGPNALFILSTAANLTNLIPSNPA